VSPRPARKRGATQNHVRRGRKKKKKKKIVLPLDVSREKEKSPVLAPVHTRRKKEKPIGDLGKKKRKRKNVGGHVFGLKGKGKKKHSPGVPRRGKRGASLEEEEKRKKKKREKVADRSSDPAFSASETRGRKKGKKGKSGTPAHHILFQEEREKKQPRLSWKGEKKKKKNGLLLRPLSKERGKGKKKKEGERARPFPEAGRGGKGPKKRFHPQGKGKKGESPFLSQDR